MKILGERLFVFVEKLNLQQREMKKAILCLQ